MMPFAYYKRLTAMQKKIYKQSDAISTLALQAAPHYHEGLVRLQTYLAKGDRDGTQRLTEWLVRSLMNAYQVPHVHVKVLAKRPSNTWGELHGLYELSSGPNDPAAITVWMRTAKRKEVVAFKTYLRTVIHECLHHLDYTHLHLADSFHTQGFYQRESSLVRQLFSC
jgi:hypothetical protein